MRFRYTILLLLFVPGCEADGRRLLDALVWMGNHPALAGVAVMFLSPLIAMIPGVGLPMSALFAKLGIALIPALKELAAAVEKDEHDKLSVGESAGVVVGQLASNRDSKVGKMPGIGAVVNVAAAAVVRQSRRERRRARRAARRNQ